MAKRLDRPIDLGLDGCDGMESVGIARRGRRRELPLHRGDAAVSAVELEAIGDGAFLAAVGHDLSAQRRGEEDEGRESVDVVLDDGVAHLDQPHQRGVETDVRCDLAVPNPGRLSAPRCRRRTG